MSWLMTGLDLKISLLVISCVKIYHNSAYFCRKEKSLSSFATQKATIVT